MKHASIWLCLFLVLIIRPFLLHLVPLVDTTEGRYAIIAKEMADSGDFVTPRINYHGEIIPYWGKPPLYFWITALCIQLFAAGEFSVRLPAYLSSLFLLAIIFAVLRRYRGAYEAVAAVLITATSAAFYMMGGAVEIDMTLSLFATGALFLYFAFLHEKSLKGKKLLSCAVFLFLALGFLTKGPVSLLFFGIPVFVWTLLNRSWHTLKALAWAPGILLFLLVTVPWFVKAEAATPGFLRYFFLEENILRFISEDYGDLYGRGHVYPHGFAILMMFVAVLPWTVICPLILIESRKRAPRIRRGKGNIRHFFMTYLRESKENIGFFCCGFIFITVFWIFARQLLLTYLLPAVPLWSAWCAHIFKKKNLSLRLIGGIALVLAVLYTFGHLPMMYVMGQNRSTRGILEAANAYRERMNLHGKIIFTKKIPYSAYFYGGNVLLQHPNETTGDSIRNGMAQDEGHIYICKKKYSDRIPEEYRERLAVIDDCGRWLLLVEQNDSRKYPVSGAEH